MSPLARPCTICSGSHSASSHRQLARAASPNTSHRHFMNSHSPSPSPPTSRHPSPERLHFIPLTPGRESRRIRLEREQENWSRTRRNRLIQVFRQFDLDQSGFIAPSELLKLGKARRSLGQKGGSWTREKNDALIAKMDLNRDGLISEYEFARHFMSAFEAYLDPEVFNSTCADLMEVASACCDGTWVSPRRRSPARTASHTPRDGRNSGSPVRYGRNSGSPVRYGRNSGSPRTPRNETQVSADGNIHGFFSPLSAEALRAEIQAAVAVEDYLEAARLKDLLVTSSEQLRAQIQAAVAAEDYLEAARLKDLSQRFGYTEDINSTRHRVQSHPLDSS